MTIVGRPGRRIQRTRVSASLARRAVAGIVPGDHVCASYGSDDEHRALVGRFARQALRRNERLLYLAHRSDEATIRSYLRDEGIDVDAGVSLGQIELRRGDHGGDRIDPETLVAALQADRAAARRDGYSALCAATEMSWVLTRPAELDSAVRFECEVDSVYATGDIAGLCQYDRRLFAPDVLDAFIATHDFNLYTAPDLTTTSRRRLVVSERGDGVVALSGELDIDSSAFIAARLAACDGEGDLVVDTSGLQFADISGCRALVRAAESLGDDRRIVLRDPAPPLLQVLRLCGWSPDSRLVLARARRSRRWRPETRSSAP